MIEQWLKLLVALLSLVWITTVEVVIGLPIVSVTLALLVAYFMQLGRLGWVVTAGIILSSIYGMSWLVGVGGLLLGHLITVHGNQVVRRPALRLLLVVLMFSLAVRFLADIAITRGVLIGFVAGSVASIGLIGKLLGWRGETKTRYRPIS